MIEDLQPDLGKAFFVSNIERLGPRRIFAHDHCSLHVQAVDQKSLAPSQTERASKAEVR